MTTDSGLQAAQGDMPVAVQRALADFVDAAKDSFQDDLISVVLFGSGAENRLRATSDLNLLVVLKQFRAERADCFREPLRLAYVAARASAMFVLESELSAAAAVFPVKFADIDRRRRVLYGELPVALLAVSPEAKKQQLRQMLMNLALRLRQRYIVAGLREEQLAVMIAEFAGPLRTAAATLVELGGQTVASPKECLESIVRSLDGGGWDQTLRSVSEARETGRLSPGEARPLMFQIMALVEAMRLRVERLP
jgi:predicted nucleotidyltransferase